MRWKTNGAKPLHVDAVEGHADVIKQLIAARCNVDTQTKMGHTSLHLAVGYGHAAVTKHLIAARCRVDIQDKDGCTSFFIVVQQGHVDIVEQLINARCKIDLASTSRFTEKARGHTRIMTMIQKGLNGHNKDNGSYEIDTRLSSRSESPHVDSPFILLGRCLSSPCISILRMPDSILKIVRVHHADTRFDHPIPPLASYNREYLQTRIEMRILGVLNKQNRKDIRAADGLDKLPLGRRRILTRLQVLQMLCILSLRSLE